MQTLVMEMLSCPACHGDLDWQIAEQTHTKIQNGTATCQDCGAEYHVRDGIALFLTPDLPREDLWAQVNNRFAKIFREHPEVEQKLMTTPLEKLDPADQFFRSMALEEQGQWAESLAISRHIDKHLYSVDYITGQRQQIEYVHEYIQDLTQPVVDLACGRGRLVEELLRNTTVPVVATDFSPQILRRNRDYFAHIGLAERLSLVACDARRLPFKNQSIPTLTSFLGLANIEKAGDVIRELKRVVGGQLLAISIFYDPADTPHAELIKQFGMEGLLFEMALLSQFADLGWDATLAQRFEAQIFPTPKSEILGTRVDGLPIAETILTWGTLTASNRS